MKKIDRRIWNSYIFKLSKINEAAADEMWSWIAKHSVYDLDEMIEFAYALVVKYGEASAALSAEMYDLTVELAEKHYPPAIPAAPPDKREVADAITETAKSENPKLISYSVSRLVKVTGVDTTMQNALRDGAEWAWIPIGETCAFCLTLASRGWQRHPTKPSETDMHLISMLTVTVPMQLDLMTAWMLKDMTPQPTMICMPHSQETQKTR